MAPPGILSSISSWWGTGSSGSGPASSSAYYGNNDANKSPYSSSYSAWTTSPYNERGSGAAANYPPQPRTSFNLARPSASVADFTNMYPTGSSSNLVSPQAPHASGAYPYDTNGSSSASGAGIAADENNHGTPHYSTSTRAAVSTGSVMMPSTAYPPLRHTWNRIRKWSRRNYAELSDTLNWPATEVQIDQLEMTIGMVLPPAVRESFLCYNGQESESKQSCSDGLFFGLTLLSLERVAEEWAFWRAVDEDPATGANGDVNAAMASCPDGWVRPVYSCRGWIPLISDNVGNYIGIDLVPHPSGAGSPGQVIAFGRDLDTKVVLWRGDGEGGWGRFLQSFVEELEAGECYTLGDEGETASSGEEEDSIGYEPYFSNGGAGASKGGGDRGGDGAVAFRLTGEYKGWPVIEAWADRSIRFWQTVGLQASMPNGGPEARQRYDDSLDGPNGMSGPRVRIADANDDDDDAYASARDEINANAAAAAAAGQTREQGASSASGLPSGQSGQVQETSLSAGQTHPLEDVETASASGEADAMNPSRTDDTLDSNGDPTPSGSVPRILTEPAPETDDGAEADATGGADAPARNIGDTLSPPMPTTKGWRSKQKQREGDQTGQANSLAAAARRRSPPTPAAPIVLPTLEEVLSEQAAVLAEDGGPPIDTNELYAARSTVPLSNSGGVAALLPTALGGVGGLSRVLSTRRTSANRNSTGGGSGSLSGNAGLGSSSGGVFGSKHAGYWDGPGRTSGMSSPVHRDSLTPLGSPRRSADETVNGDGKRSSWNLASAAAAGLGVLGTTLSGQRSPRQSYVGGHGAEGSGGSIGSIGNGSGLSSVHVVGQQENSVELSNRMSADDSASVGRSLFATDGSLGPARNAHSPSPLQNQTRVNGSEHTSDRFDADNTGNDSSLQASRRRDLSHRSPLQSPNLRGQYDSSIFTPADDVVRPSSVSRGSEGRTASRTPTGKTGDLLLDTPNSPLADDTPVALSTAKVDA